jgi:excisionase family DNA binding protein
MPQLNGRGDNSTQGRITECDEGAVMSRSIDMSELDEIVGSAARDSALQLEPLLLRASEVAKLLGLGRSKVYEMMQHGQLPVVRIGKAIRVPSQALSDWIRAKTAQPV